jgi:hypothetical protein
MGGVKEFKRRPERSIEHRKFSEPDELQEFELRKVETVSLGGETFSRVTYEPGWRWSTHVKPVANTLSCKVRHLSLIVSGRLHVLLDTGDEYEFGPGEVGEIPTGHDAWVVGDKAVVTIDISGTEYYGTKK